MSAGGTVIGVGLVSAIAEASRGRTSEDRTCPITYWGITQSSTGEKGVRGEDVM